MKSNLSNVATVMTLLPIADALACSTVQVIERALPDSSGVDKFNAAAAKVNAVITTSPAEMGLHAVKDLTGPLINGWVAAFNASGTFTHGSLETPPTDLPADSPPA